MRHPAGAGGRNSMRKSTKNLHSEMKSTRNINDLLDNNKETFNASKYSTQLSCALNQLLKDKGLKQADVIKRSGLKAIHACHIFSGTKNASRDKVLALCVGMQLTPEQANRLLYVSGYAELYDKNERDFIIIHGLEHGKAVTEINEILYDRGHKLLE